LWEGKRGKDLLKKKKEMKVSARAHQKRPSSAREGRDPSNSLDLKIANVTAEGCSCSINEKKTNPEVGALFNPSVRNKE